MTQMKSRLKIERPSLVPTSHFTLWESKLPARTSQHYSQSTHSTDIFVGSWNRKTHQDDLPTWVIAPGVESMHGSRPMLKILNGRILASSRSPRRVSIADAERPSLFISRICVHSALSSCETQDAGRSVLATQMRHRNRCRTDEKTSVELESERRH
ncbi:hypothetical protein BDV59DRAFT_24852 [Aspergillus ambiguus]|uniref:uncharacterized protein n=1 Tax=Aspergillus ambiguus TaxID=176160 RepID=UPI003CCE0430